MAHTVADMTQPKNAAGSLALLSQKTGASDARASALHPNLCVSGGKLAPLSHVLLPSPFVLPPVWPPQRLWGSRALPLALLPWCARVVLACSAPACLRRAVAYTLPRPDGPSLFSPSAVPSSSRRSPSSRPPLHTFSALTLGSTVALLRATPSPSWPSGCALCSRGVSSNTAAT